MDTQRKRLIAAWALEAIGVGEHEGAPYRYALGGSLALEHYGLTYRDPGDIDLFTESLTAGVDAEVRLGEAMAARGLSLQVLARGAPNDSSILARITDPGEPPEGQHVHVQLVPMGDGVIEHAEGLGPIQALPSLVAGKVQFLVDRRASKDFMDLACILTAADHDPRVAAAVEEAMGAERPLLMLAALHDFSEHSDTRVLAATGLAGPLVADARARIADAADRVSTGTEFALKATRALATGEQPLSVAQALEGFDRIVANLPFSALADSEATSFQSTAWRAANDADKAARAQIHAAAVLARAFKQHGGEVAQMLREDGQPEAVVECAIVAARVELARATRRTRQLVQAEQEATGEAHEISGELARRIALDADQRAAEITIRRILTGHTAVGAEPTREHVLAQATKLTVAELGALPALAQRETAALDELVAVSTAVASLSALAEAVAQAEADATGRRERLQTLALDRARAADPELAGQADAILIARMDASDPGWRQQVLADAARYLAVPRDERADLDLATGLPLFDAADADLEPLRARLAALPAPDARPRAEQDAILQRWVQAVHAAASERAPVPPPDPQQAEPHIAHWRQRAHGALSDQMLAQAVAYNLAIARDAEQAAAAGVQAGLDPAAINAAARALNPVLAVAHDALTPDAHVDAQWNDLLAQVRAAAAQQADSPVHDELARRGAQARETVAGYQAEIQVRRALEPARALGETLERTLEATLRANGARATPTPTLQPYAGPLAAELEPPASPPLPGLEP